jgi:single-stranded DNA-binding protein
MAVYGPTKTRPSQPTPDMKGNVKISSEQMKGLIAQAKEGKEPKIQIASWNRKAKDTGQEYQYVTAEVFWDAEAQAAPPPPPPPQTEPQPITFEEDDIPF